MAITKKNLNTLEINRLTRTQYNGATSLNPDAIYIEDPEFAGNKLLMTNSAGEIVEADASANDIPGVVNNVTSTSTGDALSANMGRELQEEINNLKARGKFLSIWSANLGKPTTEPTTSPYNYSVGDYFIVGTIAESGGTNYRPNGSQYIIGSTSTTVETAEVAEGDVYYYDETKWILQANTQKEITFANIAGQPSDNTNLATALDGKLERVKINGTALTVTDKAVNIPLANNSTTLGVVKTNYATFGVGVDNTGTLYISGASEAQLQAKSSGYKPVVASNVDIAVREGLGNNQLTWTEPYKEHAREVIGATKVTWNFYED